MKLTIGERLAYGFPGIWIIGQILAGFWSTDAGLIYFGLSLGLLIVALFTMIIGLIVYGLIKCIKGR